LYDRPKTAGLALGSQKEIAMNKLTLLAICFAICTPALAAVPCSHEPALVSSDLSSLSFGGLEAQGTSYDISLGITPDLSLTLTAAEETLEINPGNTLDLGSGVLSLDCVSYLSDTFFLDLELQNTEPSVDLTVKGFGVNFNPALQGLWNIEYDNNFPDDLLSIQEDGSVNLGGNPGVLDVAEDGFFFDLTFSTFAGTVIRAGGFSGTFNHLGQSGEFEATPRDSGTSLSLNNNRFSVELQWRDFADNTGNGRAVPLTEDSGGFYFFGPDNVELTVRLLDQCALSGFNSYWVFVGGSTDVEFTLSVTDTQTSNLKTYENPLGNSFAGITDTQAFATCP